MFQLQSPTLIFGDIYLSRNILAAIRKKCEESQWVVKSLSTESLDEIRMEACVSSFDDTEKILVLQNIPNRKQVRDFILNLAETCPTSTKLILWDSENHIKVDSKTKTFDKTWQEFIDAFKTIKGYKIVNNGEKLTEKDDDDNQTFITKCFAKFNKTIAPKEIKLLLSIIGYDRGMLFSDIRKMCLTCPDQIDSQFIIDNAFYSNKEAILYKLNNVLDCGSYEDSVSMLEQYTEMDVNANVIAEIFVKKARWQMVATYFYHAGLDWGSIPSRLMDMGKFPSEIWHNDNMAPQQKQQEAEQYQGAESISAFMTRKQGIPSEYIKAPVEKKKTKAKGTMTRKNAEIIPMYFMAQQTVDFVREKIVNPNEGEINLKDKVLNRAIMVYLFVQRKLAEIRYGESPSVCLQEMVKKLTDIQLVA